MKTTYVMRAGEIVEKAPERSSDEIVALEFEGSPMLTAGVAWEYHIADWRGVFGTPAPEAPTAIGNWEEMLDITATDLEGDQTLDEIAWFSALGKPGTATRIALARDIRAALEEVTTLRGVCDHAHRILAEMGRITAQRDEAYRVISENGIIADLQRDGWRARAVAAEEKLREAHRDYNELAAALTPKERD